MSTSKLTSATTSLPSIKSGRTSAPSLRFSRSISAPITPLTPKRTRSKKHKRKSDGVSPPAAADDTASPVLVRRRSTSFWHNWRKSTGNKNRHSYSTSIEESSSEEASSDEDGDHLIQQIELGGRLLDNHSGNLLASLNISTGAFRHGSREDIKSKLGIVGQDDSDNELLSVLHRGIKPRRRSKSY